MTLRVDDQPDQAVHPGIPRCLSDDNWLGFVGIEILTTFNGKWVVGTKSFMDLGISIH